MAATKRARVARAMVMAMRVVGDKEGEGDDKKDGGGNEGGVRQRGRWRRRVTKLGYFGTYLRYLPTSPTSRHCDNIPANPSWINDIPLQSHDVI